MAISCLPIIDYLYVSQTQADYKVDNLPEVRFDHLEFSRFRNSIHQVQSH